MHRALLQVLPWLLLVLLRVHPELLRPLLPWLLL
jgi:hypothetical protein